MYTRDPKLNIGIVFVLYINIFEIRCAFFYYGLLYFFYFFSDCRDGTKYRVIHKSMKHVRKLADATVV